MTFHAWLTVLHIPYPAASTFQDLWTVTEEEKNCIVNGFAFFYRNELLISGRSGNDKQLLEWTYSMRRPMWPLFSNCCERILTGPITWLLALFRSHDFSPSRRVRLQHSKVRYHSLHFKERFLLRFHTPHYPPSRYPHQHLRLRSPPHRCSQHLCPLRCSHFICHPQVSHWTWLIAHRPNGRRHLPAAISREKLNSDSLGYMAYSCFLRETAFCLA